MYERHTENTKAVEISSYVLFHLSLYITFHLYYEFLFEDLCPSYLLSAFRPRGVPGPTSKLPPRVPAQMGRREAEHEGGKGTGKGETRGLRVALRPGRVRLQ
jgi:hypothetical protein